MGSDSELDPSDQTSVQQARRQIECDVCHDLRLDSPNAKEWFYFPPWRTRAAVLFLYYEDTLKMELSGCNTCCIILHAVNLYSPQRLPSSMNLEIQAMDDAFQKLFPLNIRIEIAMTESEMVSETDSDRELELDSQPEKSMPENSDGSDEPIEDSYRDGGDELPIENLEGNDERMSDDSVEEEEVEEDYYEGNEQAENATEVFRSINLQLYEEEGHPSGIATGPARPISQYPGSSRCMDLLRSWLSRCCECHEACTSPTTATLPTRVISVGSETTLPRLYIQDSDERGSYAALSHCWGGHVPLQTRSKIDLERFQLGIPEETLPPTFLDAVYVCRQLQIPFLWIDSLCIIQDDKEDWSQESSHMGSYYGGATLTIAADYAQNSSEGCLRERPSYAWNSHRIEKQRFALNNDVYVRNMPAVIDDELGHSFRERSDTAGQSRATSKSPLNLRAWTLQEWFLSRRIVHFTAEEMVWECDQEVCCECAIDQDPDHRRTARKVPLRSLVNDDLAVYEEWTKIVKEFSMRQITYEKDRLPAISGVAEIFSKVTKDTYVCGIWKNCPLSLAWKYYFDDENPRCRQTDFYAPSWSWASMTGTIQSYNLNRDFNYRTFAEILEIDWEPASKNVFGLANRANLKIQGPVFTGKYDGFGGRFCEAEDGSDEEEAGYAFGHWFSIEGRPSTCTLDLDFSSTDLEPSDFDRLEDKANPDLQCGDGFLVLVIGEHLDEEEEPEHRGLVLRVVDESIPTYRRIGTYYGRYWKAETPERMFAQERALIVI